MASPDNPLLNVGRSWMVGASPEDGRIINERGQLETATPHGWGDDGLRVMRLEQWRGGPDQPRPWLVSVGGVAGTPVERYVQGVRQFFEAVAKDSAGRPEGEEGASGVPAFAQSAVGDLHRLSAVVGFHTSTRQGHRRPTRE